MQNSKSIKVVVTGPESTGKSTLCAQLAAHFDTVWVKEFAREYLITNGKEYTYDDLLKIALGQIHAEEEGIRLASEAGKKIVFIDTDMYVMKIWSEFVFGKCELYILNQIAQRDYDLYLLCNTDLPWVKDELREYPDLPVREKLYHYYKDCMMHQFVPWVTVSGQNEERLEKAIMAVNNLLSLKPPSFSENTKHEQRNQQH